jgi:DNA-directed RNA polymerase specialized sigma24 family protein
MTTTGDRQFTPGTEGRSARCVLCHGEQETVIEPIEEPAPPGTTLDDFICDHCFEGLKKDGEILDRLLSILTSLEREVINLRYGRYDRCYYSFDEIGERLGITPQHVAEIEEQALEKTRAEYRRGDR